MTETTNRKTNCDDLIKPLPPTGPSPSGRGLKPGRQTGVDVLEMLKETGAVLEGHFRLSSGRHSDFYVQCALALQYPRVGETIGRSLAALYATGAESGEVEPMVDAVIGPALGGILVSYEVARALGVRSLFAERQESTLALRRGFVIRKGERVLVVEDVITTGGSVKEVVSLVRDAEASVVGIGCVVDRSSGRGRFGVPVFSLVSVEARDYDPASCPLCAAGVPLVKPGSRPDAV